MALNLLRLALAFLVLASHAFPLGGYGPDPLWPTGTPSRTIGGFAVGGFFALSGMLVMMSGLRRTGFDFLVSRVLRVLPGYLVVLVAVAFVLGPIISLTSSGSLAGYFNFSTQGPFTYVLRNLGFPIGIQGGINEIFVETTPFGIETGQSAVNGSLWTLPIEVRCYAVALVVVLIGRIVGPAKAAVGALLLVVSALAILQFKPELVSFVMPQLVPASMLQLLTVFLIGGVFGALAHRLKFATTLMVAGIVVFVISSVLGGLVFATVGLGSLAIVLPTLAALLRGLPSWLSHDLSYGVYIWAFPVQQTFAHAGLNANPVMYVVTTVVATTVLAVASWFMIERPALSMKKRLMKSG